MRRLLALFSVVIATVVSLAFGVGTAVADPQPSAWRMPSVWRVHGCFGAVVGADPTAAWTGGTAADAVR